MIIQQVSVFLENKSGRLVEVTQALADAGVNISALSIAETSDYGVLRCVVSHPQKAVELLRARHFSVSLTAVVCMAAPNQPGALNRALKILAEAGISVEYMYAFAIGDRALVVIRTDNIKDTISALQHHKVDLLKSSELYQV